MTNKSYVDSNTNNSYVIKVEQNCADSICKIDDINEKKDIFKDKYPIKKTSFGKIKYA